MKRRTFIQQAALALTAGVKTRAAAENLDLSKCTVVAPANATVRVKKAITVLVEEAQKRCGLTWRVGAPSHAAGEVTIYPSVTKSGLKAEGYEIRTEGNRILINGADERGLLFGVGKLLRCIEFERWSAKLNPSVANVRTSPVYPLRGHQLGYRAKTNAYDAWTVATWDQYIRDLAMFGTNAIELLPPRTDDNPDSPHFPLPPEQMMIEMSRICDEYGLDVWIWYPAMDDDADPATVESAVKEWAHIFEILPRVDAVFVPGGDPGHTAPKPMLAMMEKQKANLRRFHPKGQMWMSPQSFREEWLTEFFSVIDQDHTATWLDGIVYGPQNRMSLAQFRTRLPKRYPIRFYPDITHSTSCQFPVPEWDVAYALTEGREVINPRPQGQAEIFRTYSPMTVGFLTYSEGCNDDVNKFVWSALGWNPEMPAVEAVREFARYFAGHHYAEGFAQGLMSLERNWVGPLAANNGVSVTLAQFQDLEHKATPSLLGNWRFQQALYRAYYDAYVRGRLLEETARLQQAADVLSVVSEIGWAAVALDTGGTPSPAPPNGQDPSVLIDQAERILMQPHHSPLRERVKELGEALFNTIRMQLAVQRYQGEAVNRAANLETLDYPVTDIAWFRAQMAAIKKMAEPNKQVEAIKQLLTRTDPGPGGFYDQLGDPQHRPHLITAKKPDPEFRTSPLTGFSYPDRLGATAPMAWKSWAESLFDEALRMSYPELDPNSDYRLRVVYSGDAHKIQVRLVANESHEIHPLLTKPWPPKPLEFDLPRELTSKGQLTLSWTREQGLGANGRGCQVSEVWVIRKG